MQSDCSINIDDLLVIGGWGRARLRSTTTAALPFSARQQLHLCTMYATTDGPAEAGCAFCCNDPQIHKDVWYSFNTSVFGGNYTMHLDTCGADFDTKIAVYKFNGVGSCN
jgi:hypothetical protein